MWPAYNGLGVLDYNHLVVNHAVGWGFGDFTTNHIESYWDLLKNECIFNEGYYCNNLEKV